MRDVPRPSHQLKFLDLFDVRELWVESLHDVGILRYYSLLLNGILDSSKSDAVVDTPLLECFGRRHNERRNEFAAVAHHHDLLDQELLLEFPFNWSRRDVLAA